MKRESLAFALIVLTALLVNVPFVTAESDHALYAKGNNLLEQGKYENALTAYESDLQSDPEFADGWYSKGLALYYLGRYDEALGALENATRINGDHADAWYTKGLTLQNLKRYEEATTAFERATAAYNQQIELYSENSTALPGLEMAATIQNTSSSADPSEEQVNTVTPEPAATASAEMTPDLVTPSTSDATSDDDTFIQILRTTHEKLTKLIEEFVATANSRDLAAVRLSASKIFELTYTANAQIKPLDVSSQYQDLKADYLKMLKHYNDGAFILKQSLDDVGFSTDDALQKLDFAFDHFALGDEVNARISGTVLQVTSQ